jgi:hypothetical protein
MNKYILHIGYSKTGTTAIQNYLSSNRQLLREQGVLYPDVKMYGVWAHCQNHNMLGRALAGRCGWYGLTPNEYIGQFEKQCQYYRTKKVILSAENFLGGVQPWDYDDELNYWKAVENYVKKAGDLFSNFDTKIILYLRRQDDWLESIINQTIKSGVLAPEKLRKSSIDELIKIYLPRLNYAKTLDIWAEVFGRKAIEVGVYNKKQLFRRDVIADFCDRLNIDDSVLKKASLTNINENIKLNRDVLEFRRILNSIDRPKYQERVLGEALLYLSTKDNNIHKDNYSLLDRDRRKAIREKCHQSNKKLCSEYLPDNNQEFFEKQPEDINTKDEIYPGLSIEQSLIFLLNLERYLKLPKTRIKLFRHWIAEKLRSNSPFLHAVIRMQYYFFKKLTKNDL